MRKLLNTLYVTSPDAWLARDGECVSVKIDGEEKLKVPLINLENIISFSYAGASPALMHACAKRGIGLSFLSENGYFLRAQSEKQTATYWFGGRNTGLRITKKYR